MLSGGGCVRIPCRDSVVYRYFMPAHRATLIIVTAFLAACAHPRSGAIAAGAQPAPEEGCLLSTGPVSARAPTITIGLSDAVDPRHAPFARNDAERLVFRHLYETPVRIDCGGHVRPELAAQWEKADGGRRWTFRLRDGAQFWDGAPVTAQEIRAHTPRGDTLVFKFAASGDARDLLDAGVDLLVTRDRALRDYAATLQNHEVVALPWDRTYVYVTAEAGGGSTRFDGLEQAVRAEARRAEGDFWWRDLRVCGIGRDSAPPSPTGQRRILYTRGDPTARELAGRLAALTHAVATGRAPDDFSAALAGGKDGGYVVALPRVTADVCRSAKDLLPSWPATFTALVDTRPTAIVRRGVTRWTVDQDGRFTSRHEIPHP